MRSSYDLPADIWAFGCVLVCLFADRPFPYPRDERIASGTSGDGVFGRVLSGQLAPTLSDEDLARSHLPVALGNSMRELTGECCQHKAEARPTAASVASRLRGVREAHGNGSGLPKG